MLTLGAKDRLWLVKMLLPKTSFSFSRTRGDRELGQADICSLNPSVSTFFVLYLLDLLCLWHKGAVDDSWEVVKAL